ncbi:DEAD/DEAH box helicase [Streptomyces sp. So13.3]|uniref:DEAD/DEAH box helicase n=1 Tax=Streptomyces sp. So13.3 TaxID=2136173 RepID=UPI001FD32C1A|nr:DEAD/DEAH box helicase [Streptomyces sp. So13.3]
MLSGCVAVFLPADPPRSGRVAFHVAGSGRLPVGLPAEDVEIVTAHGRGARRRTVSAVVRPLAEVLPWVLSVDVEADAPCGETAAVWRHAALYALHLAGRGLLLPGLSAGDHDAWRLGPYAEADATWVRALAEVMPPAAYAVPLESAGEGSARTPLQLTDPYARLREFMDAVADLLPRTPAASAAAGMRPFASRDAQHLPGLRAWAAQVADGRDAGVRVSLRLELPGGAMREYADDEGDAYDEDAYDAALEVAGASVRAVVQVHSLADPLLLADAAGVFSGESGGFGPRTRVQVEDVLRRAAAAWPPLHRILSLPVPDELALDDQEFIGLLAGGAASLSAAGVAVHLPKELAREMTARAVIEPDKEAEREKDAETPAFFSPEQLLSFRWEFAVGDRTLTQGELDRLAQARRPLVRLRDQWVVVDAELLRKARRARKELGALDALAAALTGSVEDPDGVLVPVRAGGWLAALRDRLAAPERASAAELAAPAALDATLRGYQLRGLAWLDRMTRLGLGACLADDMGLGKTITTIALHLRRQEDPATAGRPALVVCPASLLGNWGREIDRFAPGTPWRRHHGPGRDLGGLKPGEIVLTTYGTMRRDAQALAEAGPWGLLVADEAQHVKNPAGATAKALRTLPSSARVALSGTPVENNLSELWALLDWGTPGLLGSLKTFRQRYGRAAERAARGGAAGEEDSAAAERLGRLIRPFVLRRRKADPGIAPELPPKTETDERVLLSREQTVLYEAQVRESLAAIREAKGIARHGLVLKLLTALKQICNHPAQYLKEPDATRLTGRSGKLELLDELLDVIVAEDASVLLFTQYTQMARLLEHHLTARGINSLYLHGGTPVKRREEMVDAFQHGEAPVFLLSLKAAGTGLNLTRAGHVIHYDRWWNPAVEDQATDRAYRIGQTQPVQVHRLISEGTVEDRIAQLLSSKRDLADSVLGGQGEAALTDLSDDELADLVSLHSAHGDRSRR